MTLRDLTKRQLYNLRRRCEKEWRVELKRQRKPYSPPFPIWLTAYNKGLKAGLEVPRT